MNITGLHGYCIVDTLFILASNVNALKWKCRHFIWWYFNHWLNWKLLFSHHPATANGEKWVNINIVFTTVHLILCHYIDVVLSFSMYFDFAYNMFYAKFFVRNNKINLYTQWHFHISVSTRAHGYMVSGDGTDKPNLFTWLFRNCPKVMCDFICHLEYCCLFSKKTYVNIW